MTARARLAVLASGGGSNLGALLAHLDALGDARAADVAAVLSDRGDARALDRARARGIPASIVAGRRAPAAEPLGAALARLAPDYVVLAGYLRLVPPDVVRAYRGRMVNVHPALLPAFGGAGMYGARVHAAVLAAGACVSGPTVHFVDEIFDHGAIAAQVAVPVHPDDDAASLAARVLAAEHWLYPRVVHALAVGDLVLDDRSRARWRVPPPYLGPSLPAPPPSLTPSR